ncbi:MAG: DNA polymerase IV [Campylobacterota bacterium]|nr:DNA polymerase IV [Campylobacterota bacterium]
MKIHIDLDCFFVSAERTVDSSLLNIPVGIGGRGDQYIFAHSKVQQQFNLDNSGAFLGAFFQSYDTSVSDIDKFKDADGRIRGILTTASYEARAYGIKTAMTIREALQLCPTLIIKAPNMKLYKTLSHELHDFLAKRIPILEQASIDEFYGDLEGWVEDEEVEHFIDMLRHEIKKELNLPVSIGAAKTKSIAKLATSSAKPFGCKTVYTHQVKEFIESIAIADFPGIGRSMQKKLLTYNIKTLGELSRNKKIVCAISPYAKALYSRVCGLDLDPVASKRERKSIGISRTFDPLYDRGELRRRVIILSRHLAFAIMKLQVFPTTFRVGIHYEMSQHSHASISQNRLFNEQWFKELILSLFSEAEQHRRLKVVRLSINCSEFTCNSKRTLSLLEFKEDTKMRQLSKTSQKMQQKYGLGILKWGSELS